MEYLDLIYDNLQKKVDAEMITLEAAQEIYNKAVAKYTFGSDSSDDDSSSLDEALLKLESYIGNDKIAEEEDAAYLESCEEAFLEELDATRLRVYESYDRGIIDEKTMENFLILTDPNFYSDPVEVA